MWSKASGVEQNPVTPKKSFYAGVEVRWIEAIGIGAHEPSRDPQRSAKCYRKMGEIPADTG